VTDKISDGQRYSAQAVWAEADLAGSSPGLAHELGRMTAELVAEAEARGFNAGRQWAIDTLRAEAFRVLQTAPKETAALEYARNLLVEAMDSADLGESS
jgi:hypothetical protein